MEGSGRKMEIASTGAAMTTSPTLAAFLSLIAWSEGADYNTIVTGEDGPATFSDFSDHPFAPQFHRPAVIVRPGLSSTAAGRYQLLYRWWVPYKFQMGLTDYSPASQDTVALQQMKERGAVDMVLAGNIQGAIEACSNIWASFPNNNYGQGGHSMGALLDKYAALSEQV
jgi:muramidase (phage lysozyme)